MKKKKYITTSEAIMLACQAGIPVSRFTVIEWCKRFGLGHQLGGRHGKWWVHRESFEDYIHDRSNVEKNSFVGPDQSTIEAQSDEQEGD